MKVSDVIEQADAIRPNALPDDIKASWVYDAECDLCHRRGLAPPQNTWPTDYDLRITPPHSRCYVYYLCAMIDNGQAETALYENDMALYNAAADAMAAEWRRGHRPKKSTGWRVM